MLLARIGPEGFYVATDTQGEMRFLHSDPFSDSPASWRFGRRVDLGLVALMAPVQPSKIVGVGRNYAAHARELGNPVPAEPLLFLKAPSAVIGPNTPIILPPVSTRVEHEGEIAIVMRSRLSQASESEALDAVLGVTAACDVTARDLQRQDATFARAKSFDSFCPIGPFIRLGQDLDGLSVSTRVNDELRQSGKVGDMLTAPAALLAYISQMMTLEPGDVVLSGTPSGVGPLAPGDRLEVEVSGVGVLSNPVEMPCQSM